MTIKNIVKDNNVADFEYYRDGILWYSVRYYDENKDYQHFTFPVPISDIGTATFNRSERAMLMMRYIRKHLETIERANNGIA